MGAIGGSVFHSIKGFRNAPSVCTTKYVTVIIFLALCFIIQVQVTKLVLIATVLVLNKQYLPVLERKSTINVHFPPKAPHYCLLI